MFTTISLTGFRAFDHVAVSNLGRVNVLVGENGAGKTSFLEAVRLLGAAGHPAALLASAIERGEYDVSEGDDGATERVAVLRFAFFGRIADSKARFIVDAQDEADQHRRVLAEVFDAAPQEPALLYPEWAIRLSLDPTGRPLYEIPIAWSRAIARRLGLAEPPGMRSAIQLPVVLRANSLDDATLARLWDAVAATPAKETVVASLRRIEPSVRDIDLRSDRDLPFRSRVSVRLSNGEEAAAPIGSLGEGITWLFALALGAAATPNKLLLVDDIDAGLHHRVMEGMWTMVLDAARRRDLQVFATTHSIDCLTALRRACEKDEQQGDDVRVVRLVKGGAAGITFTAEELATAIEGEVEVRG